jgi:hypothetical protein
MSSLIEKTVLYYKDFFSVFDLFLEASRERALIEKTKELYLL